MERNVPKDVNAHSDEEEHTICQAHTRTHAHTCQTKLLVLGEAQPAHKKKSFSFFSIVSVKILCDDSSLSDAASMKNAARRPQWFLKSPVWRRLFF